MSNERRRTRTSRGINSQGNEYQTPGGTNVLSGKSYQYVNQDGSMYYKNDDNSTFYQSPDGKKTYRRSGVKEQGSNPSSVRGSRGRGRGGLRVAETSGKQGRKQFSDYSEEWSNEIQKAHGNLKRLLELFAVLITIQRVTFPPSIPPPVDSNMVNIAHVLTEKNPTNSFNSNKFSALEEEESEEDLISSQLNSVTIGAPTKSTHTAGKSNVSIQARYLILRLICGLAENHRKQSAAYLAEKSWKFAADQLGEAYNLINGALQQYDEWWALLAQFQEDKLPITNYHQPQYLEQTLDELLIVEENSERERSSALDRMYSQQERLSAKLAPMLEERDFTKVKIGIDKWTNNPAPKLTFAERRRLLELELSEVSIAVNIVESLDFISACE